MAFLGALVGLIPVVLVAAGAVALGGVPDIEIDAPHDRPIRRRR